MNLGARFPCVFPSPAVIRMTYAMLRLEKGLLTLLGEPIIDKIKNFERFWMEKIN